LINNTKLNTLAKDRKSCVILLKPIFKLEGSEDYYRQLLILPFKIVRIKSGLQIWQELFNIILNNYRFIKIPKPKYIIIKGIYYKDIDEEGFVTFGKSFKYTIDTTDSQLLSHFNKRMNDLFEEGYDLSSLSRIIVTIRQLRLPFEKGD